MSWSFVLIAALTMVGAVLGVAIAIVLVATVPTLRKATLAAVRSAPRTGTNSPLRNESHTPVGSSAIIEASRAAAHQRYRAARLGYFVIETEHAERTRLLVEMFLERETKRWRLDGSTGNGNGLGKRSPNGRATLMYLVRFRRNAPPATVLERLSAVGQPEDFTVRLETDPGDAS